MLSVTTNTAALTAQRNLSTNSDMASSSIARMSSGTRIVKPSDDASSLAISNKLRADIVSLEQAGRNASQGASLLQVANGAYDNIGNMLARMKVLATQVINGTLGTTERLYAQEEFNNLRTQISNTANQTRFGSVNLLSGGGGNYLNSAVLAAANAGSTSNVSDLNAAAAGLTAATNDTFTEASVEAGVNTGFVNGAVSNISVSISGTSFQISMQVGNQTFVGRIDDSNNAANDSVRLTSSSNSGNTIELTIGTALTDGVYTEAQRANIEDGLRILMAGATYSSINAAPATEDNGFTADGGTVGVDQNGTTVPVQAGPGTAAGLYRFQYVSTGDSTAAGSSGYVNGADNRAGTGFFELTDGANTWIVDQKDIQISGTEGSAGALGVVTFGNGLKVYMDMGSTAANAFERDVSSTATHLIKIGDGGGVSLSFQVSDKATDQATITFGAANASALGLDGLSVADATSAATASARLDAAINTVNTAQASIGALQSRFEYIQSTISTTVENVSAARGTFRDVDMAAEMTAFTKSQTLMQASVAMLSQANQMPQQLLRLLQ